MSIVLKSRNPEKDGERRERRPGRDNGVSKGTEVEMRNKLLESRDCIFSVSSTHQYVPDG